MCAALASTLPPVRTAQVHALDRVRIERALPARARYRYVQPKVLAAEEGGWLITSPCCSRNIDPNGGVIPIAWLEPHDGVWTLYARDHVHDRWLVHHEANHLQELLDEICLDPLRVFWP